MKFPLLLLFWAILGIAQLPARDLTTLDGSTYHDIVVTQVEDSGLHVQHSSGIAFVEKANLPSDFIKEFYPDEIATETTVSTTAAVKPTPSPIPIPTTFNVEGTVYQDVKVTQVEPLGIHIQHSAGVAFIDFKFLSPSLRIRFGYNGQAYRDASAERASRQEAAAQQKAQAEVAAREAREAAMASVTAASLAAAEQRALSSDRYSSRDYSADRYETRTSTRTYVPEYKKTHYVSGYYRKNGTYVHSYKRR